MYKSDYSNIKAKLENFCAYQERSTTEVKEKLKTFDMSESEVSKIIKQLEDDNFLNDERFACSYTTGKFNIKGWGRLKIKSHLRYKGISIDLIEKGLSEIDSDLYKNRLKQLAERKVSDLEKEKNPWIKKQKVIRFLSSKGYESELIYEVLASIELHFNPI